MKSSDLVLRVLGSIGRPAEAMFYLSEFSAEKKERFATIWVEDAVARDEAHAYAVAVDLQLLSQLGLTPVLAFSSVESAQAIEMAVDPDVASRIATPAEAADIARAGKVPLVPLGPLGEEPALPALPALSDLCRRLVTQKVVFLGLRRGLELSDGEVPSLIDPVADRAMLSGRLSTDQERLLARASDLLSAVDHRMTVAITSPLQLLPELFTVRGAGTLIRVGAGVASHADARTVDRARLLALIESAFGRPVASDLLDRPIERVFIAGDYLGAAIVAPTPLAPYLSKLAVGLKARGEGIGGDLWRALVREFPRLFWRARRDNPIGGWYREQCDGMVRAGAWDVFWRGLEPGEIPAAIELAKTTPADFEGQP